MEVITIKRKNNNCELFSDLHSIKLSECDINAIKQIISDM